MTIKKIKLSDNSRTHQECCGKSNDCIQFREYGKNQSITEYIVSLTNCSDTVSTNLTLTDSREQCYKTQTDT